MWGAGHCQALPRANELIPDITRLIAWSRLTVRANEVVSKLEG